MINYISSVKIVSVKTYIELLLYGVITSFNQIKTMQSLLKRGRFYSAKEKPSYDCK